MKHSGGLNRRGFLSAAPGALLAMGAGSIGIARAIDPLVRTGKAKLKLGVAAYGVRSLLDLKAKKKPEWDLFQFATKAAEWGFKSVEPTSYYFSESGPDYLDRFREHCSKLGLEISGSAVGNNFCLADEAARKTQIDQVVDWAAKTARMGGKTLRIFAGNTAKGEKDEAAAARCIEAIKEACKRSEKSGVILALENHGGITSTADQLLKLVRGVDHPLFAVNLDTGNFRTEDPYADMAKFAPYAAVVQVKTEVQRKGKAKVPADFGRILDLLAAANFQGYFVLEYEAAEDPLTAIPREGKKLAAMIKERGL